MSDSTPETAAPAPPPVACVKCKADISASCSIGQIPTPWGAQLVTLFPFVCPSCRQPLVERANVIAPVRLGAMAGRN